MSELMCTKPTERCPACVNPLSPQDALSFPYTSDQPRSPLKEKLPTLPHSGSRCLAEEMAGVLVATGTVPFGSGAREDWLFGWPRTCEPSLPGCVTCPKCLLLCPPSSRPGTLVSTTPRPHQIAEGPPAVCRLQAAVGEGRK